MTGSRLIRGQSQGRKYSADVPLRQRSAAPFFDGAPDDKSRAIMRQAELDIEKYRNGSFTLERVDAKGNPVQAEVKVELRQHAFKFGTNLFGLSAMPDSALKRTAFATAKEIFNTVVVCDYWRSPDRQEQERKRDQPLEDLRWAEANGTSPAESARASSNR